MVKTLNEDHSCIRPVDSKNPIITEKWIACKLNESLMADPSMSYELMRERLKNTWEIEPPTWQLYRAKNRVKESSEGAHADSYAKLSKYVKLLMDHNPGTVCKIEYEYRPNLDTNPVFKRLFLCIQGLKEGFLKG